MTTILQLLASLALLAVVTWGANHWIAYIGDAWTAALFGFPIILFIAFLYDRRQAQLARRADRATTEYD